MSLSRFRRKKGVSVSFGRMVALIYDKKRGRHDNERTELRLRDLGKIWVLASGFAGPSEAGRCIVCKHKGASSFSEILHSLGFRPQCNPHAARPLASQPGASFAR